MTLPSSGNAISLNQMHTEVGGTSGTTVSMNDPDIRVLTAKASNAQSDFNSFYGISGGLVSVMGVGGNITTTSSTTNYVTTFTTRKFRGYSETAEGGGVGSYGTMTNTSDSNFLGGHTIVKCRLQKTRTTTGLNPTVISGPFLVLSADSSSIANTNASFTTLRIEVTDFQRSAATYNGIASDARPGQVILVSLWIWSGSPIGTSFSAGTAITPFAADTDPLTEQGIRIF